MNINKLNKYSEWLNSLLLFINQDRCMSKLYNNQFPWFIENLFHKENKTYNVRTVQALGDSYRIQKIGTDYHNILLTSQVLKFGMIKLNQKLKTR